MNTLGGLATENPGLVAVGAIAYGATKAHRALKESARKQRALHRTLHEELEDRIFQDMFKTGEIGEWLI